MHTHKTLVAVASLFALLSPGLALADHDGKTDGFVCPVFNDKSAVGAKNPNAVQIGGGDYSIIGPNVSVPTGATNGDGTGTPGGAHSSPGDRDYTAIWAG